MKRLLAFTALAAILLLLGRLSASWLVVDHPKESDVIVVLNGDLGDVRYWRGMELLRAGFARYLLLDASDQAVEYGRKQADLAQEFIDHTAPDLGDRVRVCPVRGDSTEAESKYVGDCLHRLGSRRVLLVTSDYHTRRAYSIFKTRLPQYHWSVTAAHDEFTFGRKWWQHREWAKTTLLEWQRLLWWELVERWRGNHPSG